MKGNLIMICCWLAFLILRIRADVQSDVQKQINDATAKINQNLANAQQHNNMNAPTGSVVSVSCTSDSAGNSNCVRNASSTANNAGMIPNVQITPNTNPQPQAILLTAEVTSRPNTASLLTGLTHFILLSSIFIILM